MGLTGGTLDLVIHRMRRVAHAPAPRRHQCGQVFAWAMITWSGSGCSGLPPPARPTLASRRVPCPWGRGEVRLRGVRGRHTGMVGILARLVRFGFEYRKPGFQALHLRPQRHNEAHPFPTLIGVPVRGACPWPHYQILIKTRSRDFLRGLSTHSKNERTASN